MNNVQNNYVQICQIQRCNAVQHYSLQFTDCIFESYNTCGLFIVSIFKTAIKCMLYTIHFTDLPGHVSWWNIRRLMRCL